MSRNLTRNPWVMIFGVSKNGKVSMSTKHVTNTDMGYGLDFWFCTRTRQQKEKIADSGVLLLACICGSSKAIYFGS